MLQTKSKRIYFGNNWIIWQSSFPVYKCVSRHSVGDAKQKTSFVSDCSRTRVGPLYPMTWCKNRFAPTPCCSELYSNDQCAGIVDIRWDIGGAVAVSMGDGIVMPLLSVISNLDSWILLPPAPLLLDAACAVCVGIFRSWSRVKQFGSDAANSHDCDNDIRLPKPLVLGNVLPVTISGVVAVAVAADVFAAAVRSAAASSLSFRNSRFKAASNGFSRLVSFATGSWSAAAAMPSISIVRYTVVNVCTQKRCSGIIKLGKFFSNHRHTKPTLSVSFVKKQDWVTDVIVRVIYERCRGKQRKY